MYMESMECVLGSRNSITNVSKVLILNFKIITHSFELWTNTIPVSSEY